MACPVCRDTRGVVIRSTYDMVLQQCPICYDTNVNSVNCATLGCGHSLCLECFDKIPRPQNMQPDRQMMSTEEALVAIQADPFAVRNMTEQNTQGYGLILKTAVSFDPFVLVFAPDYIRSDETIIRRAVTQKGQALQFATEELKDNHSIVYAAIRNDSYAISFASLRLRSDSSLVRRAIQENGNLLQFVSDELRSDYELVRLAVHQCPDAIKFASHELRKNPKIAILARVPCNPHEDEYRERVFRMSEHEQLVDSVVDSDSDPYSDLRW